MLQTQANKVEPYGDLVDQTYPKFNEISTHN